MLIPGLPPCQGRSPAPVRPTGCERLAVDLGCGEGRDTVELLRRGWRVLAIEAEREAIERLRARPDLDSDAAARLETRMIPFEEADWPRADLVNSSFALPFSFPALWERIASSLGRGGRFSGQLFGDRDGWGAGSSAPISPPS